MPVNFENIIEQAEQAAQREALEPMDLAPYFVDFTRDIERPTPVISDAGDPDKIIVSEQNIFVIAGEAKSRKSFLASLLVIEFFKQHPDRKAILIDTEQAEWNVLNVARRVCRGMGWDYDAAYQDKRIQVAHLRPYTKDQRLKITEAIIAQEQPYLCIIDGARDMVPSVNDDTLCSELVDKFLKWSETYKCAIGTIIHTNKDGETARGHLGAELINKAETTLFCKKDGDRTKVSSIYARNPDIDTFTFEVDNRFVPVRSSATVTSTYELGTPKETKALNALAVKEAAEVVWVNDIRNATQVGSTTAKKYFDDFVQAGFLRRLTKDGSHYGHFSLYSAEPLPLWNDPGPEIDLDGHDQDTDDTDEQDPF